MTALAITLLMLTAPPQIGLAGAVEASATLESDSVGVGEPVLLTVSLRPVPPAVDVVFPELPDSGQLAALGPPRVVISEPGVRSARYTLVAWQIGELTVTGSAIRLLADGAEQAIPFPGLTLQVTSVLPDEADLETVAWRPPADVVGANWSTAEMASAAGLLLLLLAGAVVYLRRRGRATPVPRPEPMAPRERALVGLDMLARHGLIEAGEFKGFYSALSLILRRFLAETEGRWSLDLTTIQLMSRVGEDGVTEADVRALEALLSQADLVKFAGLRPAPAEAEATLKVARGWIEGFVRKEAPPLRSPDDAVEGWEDGAEAVLADLEEVFVAEDGEPVAGDGDHEGLKT